MKPERENPLIGIVGVCASGKSTLIARLTELGCNCRHIAQEHSYVQTMWKQLTDPDILIYLEVSYAMTIQRRKLDWSLEEFEEQIRRLADAKEHADIVIDTDSLTAEEVAAQAMTRIRTLMSSR